MMKSWGKLAQRLRVPVGTVIGILFLILMRPSWHSLSVGGAVALVGVLLRLWASGHIDKGKALTKGGPYACSRNPLYLGSLFLALGVIAAGQAFWLLVPFGVFFSTFYYPVMKAEEAELLSGYGSKFMEYRQEVPIFFPRFSRNRMAEARSTSIFRWSRVTHNGEHRTLIGFLLIETFLIIKTLA